MVRIAIGRMTGEQNKNPQLSTGRKKAVETISAFHSPLGAAVHQPDYKTLSAFSH
jgi:methylglyoxal synthase